MPTLRNMIMTIKSKIDGSPLFVSVNFQWNNQARSIFTYRKKLTVKAKACIPTLLTYLQNTTAYKRCAIYFTPSAQNASAMNAWDSTTDDVIRAAALFVPSDAINEDIKLLGLEEYINYTEATAPEISRAENIYLGDEVRSVTRSLLVIHHKRQPLNLMTLVQWAPLTRHNKQQPSMAPTTLNSWHFQICRNLC
jgi:hypothetical protein